MNVRLLLPSLLIAAVVIAAATFFTSHRLRTSDAGALPTPAVAVHPGFDGSPPPLPTPLPRRAGAAVMDSATAVQKAIGSVAAKGENASRINAAAVQSQSHLDTFGALTDLAALAPRYASDYPVWVVTMPNTVGASVADPRGFLITPDSITIYLDGYSGEEMERVLSGGSPPSQSALATADAHARAVSTPHRAE